MLDKTRAPLTSSSPPLNALCWQPIGWVESLNWIMALPSLTSPDPNHNPSQSRSRNPNSYRPLISKELQPEAATTYGFCSDGLGLPTWPMELWEWPDIMRHCDVLVVCITEAVKLNTDMRQTRLLKTWKLACQIEAREAWCHQTLCIKPWESEQLNQPKAHQENLPCQAHL